MFAYLSVCVLAIGALFASFGLRRRGDQKRWLGRTTSRLFLVIFALLSVLAVAETAFRYFLDFTDPTAGGKMGPRWVARHYQFNSLGFRDREHFFRRSSGTRRITVLGDSFVEGYGVVDTADRFSDQLETRLLLDPEQPEIEVINMGRSGWTTRDEVKQFAEKGYRYNPDVLVLAYFLNDIEDIRPANPTNPQRPAAVTQWLIDHFYSINFLYWRFDGGQQGMERHIMDSFKDKDVLAEHASDLMRLQNICDAEGTRLLVMILPVLAPQDLQGELRAVHKTVRQLMQKHNVEFFDLWKEMEDVPYTDLRVSPWDGHLNAYGNKLAAKKLYTHLATKGYLQ